MTKTKVLLDTDIGSDIDDAVCLAYLLAQPACDLVGITTVTGNVLQRAQLADVLCKVAGREVPVFPGLARPLIAPLRQGDVPQAASLQHWAHGTEFPGNAIDFIRKTIREQPGEITLLAIGPLTNVAAAFVVEPELPKMLKELVLMGGNFTPVRRPPTGSVPVEWNIMNDPHAAAIVFRAPVPRIRAVGLDVTTHVTMNKDQVHQHFQKKLLIPVADFSESWFRQRHDLMTFHDPLAAVTIFDESVCTFEQGTVEIELSSEKLAGFTFWKPGTGKHEVARTVNPKAFFDHYFAQFKT